MKIVRKYEDTTYVCLPFNYRLIFRDGKYVGWYRA